MTKTTAFTYSNGNKLATLIGSFIADDGAKIEVVEQAGRFFIKRNGTQAGNTYGDRGSAVLKAQAAAYLGEEL